MGKLNGKTLIGIGLGALSIAAQVLNFVKESKTQSEIIDKSAERAAKIVMEQMNSTDKN